MNSSAPDLWVVIPIYNEQDALEPVVDEWLACFRKLHCKFTVCLINDGSTDGSAVIIKTLADTIPEIFSVNKENSGHGQSCLHGYQLAIAHDAEFIFQIDSDGQCDPQFFAGMWEKRYEHSAIFGNRKFRNDGLFRRNISRALSLTTTLSTGVRTPDPNVPYRLIKSDVLKQALEIVPPNVDLANVFLAIILQSRKQILWMDIGFRQRRSGKSTVNPFSLLSKGLALSKQMLRFRRQHRITR